MADSSCPGEQLGRGRGSWASLGATAEGQAGDKQGLLSQVTHRQDGVMGRRPPIQETARHPTPPPCPAVLS